MCLNENHQPEFEIVPEITEACGYFKDEISSKFKYEVGVQ